jgi:hypothetical protein
MTSSEDLLDISSDPEEIQEHEWTMEELWRVPRAPGKFEGEPILARVLHELWVNGMSDDQVDFISEEDALFNGFALKGVGPVYAILTETNEGFVYLGTFDNQRALMDRWKELQKASEKEARSG